MIDDLICPVCGEPWSEYGVMHGDMTPEERENFLSGKGCPICKGKGERLHEAEAVAAAVMNSEDPDRILDGLGF
jgi:hypothetical protein